MSVSSRLWQVIRFYELSDGRRFQLLSVNLARDQLHVIWTDRKQSVIDCSLVHDARLVAIVAPSGILLDWDMPDGNDLGGEA